MGTPTTMLLGDGRRASNRGAGLGRSAAWTIGWLALACGVAFAATPDDLFEAQTIVTGQREETRLPALRQCLLDVLIKVSGDPKIADDPTADAMTGDAASYLGAFRYRDLLEGIPIHDEQGTRDRPYQLTADFDPSKVEAALRSVGREPWLGKRPRVAVFLAVHLDTGAYLLAADGRRGQDQRDALAAAAWKFGVPLVLPTRQWLEDRNMSVEGLPSSGSAGLEAAATAMGGDVALLGSLAWSTEDLGWLAAWRLASRPKSQEWQIRGVSFDQAFGDAMSHTLQYLSAHRDAN